MVSHPLPSPIAGSVLPIKRAEELLATLPGVIAARIIAADTGAVDEIHVLTTAEVTPKQTVRNIESALIAHLGMRVDHRKISVATSVEPRPMAQRAPEPVRETPSRETPRSSSPVQPIRETARETPRVTESVREPVKEPRAVAEAGSSRGRETPTRIFYFEDIEVRRSRARGLFCRVTLVKGDQSFVGEVEGGENERSRVELAAKAALRAIAEGEAAARPLELEGAKLIEAFEREFVFVGVTAQLSRERALLTGSCEVKDSAETASVLAILDATNRWLLRVREGR
jgi:hypothetical protein